MDMAEQTYVQSPEKVAHALERVNIKRMMVKEKHDALLELARQLIRDQIIAIPPLVWGPPDAIDQEGNGNDTYVLPPPDQLIKNRMFPSYPDSEKTKC